LCTRIPSDNRFTASHKPARESKGALILGARHTGRQPSNHGRVMLHTSKHALPVPRATVLRAPALPYPRD